MFKNLLIFLLSVFLLISCSKKSKEEEDKILQNLKDRMERTIEIQKKKILF